MATISIELGKSSSQRQREVYLLVRQGDSRRRIKTGVKLLETEYITNKGKIRIRSLLKARAVEKLKNDLENSLEVINQVSLGESEDAEHIALRLIKKQESKALDFFVFSEDWIERTNIKGAKNYKCMLNTLEKFNGSRKLLFQDIDVRFLKDFERYLEKRPRAQSLYLGEIRHLFREATIECNTDEETVIKNNPFQRYKTPKQVMKKGVRALSLEDFLKIANYHPDGKGRKLLAHDNFKIQPN